MNPLMMLLGQQAGVPAAEAGEEIFVNAKRGSGSGDSDVGVRLLGNRSDIADSQDAVERGQEASQRKGMFGIKGTLRDILGTLGDAFLVGSGGSPLYMPRRDEERRGDAAAGYTENPEAAAERLAQLPGGLAIGQNLIEQAQKTAYENARIDSLNGSRDSLEAKRRSDMIGNGRKVAQQVLAQRGAYDETGELTQDARQLLDLIAQQSEGTVGELIGDGLSGNAMRLYGESGQTVNQQQRLPLEERRTAASESQARSSAVRAARPPAGRSAPQPTRASMLEDFLRIPRNERTPEQQNFIDRETTPSRSQRRGQRSGEAEPTTRRFGIPRN